MILAKLPVTLQLAGMFFVTTVPTATSGASPMAPLLQNL